MLLSLYRYVEECIQCGINDSSTKAEDVVKEVEEWSVAHLLKTRQSEFLSRYPNAKVREGVLAICPQAVEGESYNNTWL